MKSYYFYLTIIIVILLGFILLVPKVATRIFPFAREKLLQDFIADVKNNQTIESKKFWMLREYYSPGSFVFREKGLSKNEADPALKIFNVSFNKKEYVYPFLIFTSEKFKSIEAITKTTDLNRIISNLEMIKGKSCIIDQKSMFICYKDEHTIYIVFIKPMNEMQKTNGFFDYKRQDLADLTKGKSWLVISKITN